MYVDDGYNESLRDYLSRITLQIEIDGSIGCDNYIQDEETYKFRNIINNIYEEIDGEEERIC